MVLSDAPGVVLLLFSFSYDLTSPSRTLPQGDDRNPAVIGQFVSKNVFPFSHGQIHGIIAENSFSALRSALRGACSGGASLLWASMTAGAAAEVWSLWPPIGWSSRSQGLSWS